jgi:hypothetical protein
MNLRGGWYDPLSQMEAAPAVICLTKFRREVISFMPARLGEIYKNVYDNGQPQSPCTVIEVSKPNLQGGNL